MMQLSPSRLVLTTWSMARGNLILRDHPRPPEGTARNLVDGEVAPVDLCEGPEKPPCGGPRTCRRVGAAQAHRRAAAEDQRLAFVDHLQVGPPEGQPRCSRSAAEVQPKCSRETARDSPEAADV